jgi:hypothetical protein
MSTTSSGYVHEVRQQECRRRPTSGDHRYLVALQPAPDSRSHKPLRLLSSQSATVLRHYDFCQSNKIFDIARTYLISICRCDVKGSRRLMDGSAWRRENTPQLKKVP